MVEVNGLCCFCVKILSEAPAAHGCTRHSKETRCVGLVVTGNACVHLLCFMYSLSVGSRRTSPRLASFAFNTSDISSEC